MRKYAEIGDKNPSGYFVDDTIHHVEVLGLPRLALSLITTRNTTEGTPFQSCFCPTWMRQSARSESSDRLRHRRYANFDRHGLSAAAERNALHRRYIAVIAAPAHGDMAV